MSTPIIEFSQTSKGKRLLICDGYAYNLNKDNGKVKYWRCEERPCSAAIHTDKNYQFLALKGAHDHLPSPERIEIMELKRKVKTRV